ncbi:hypothetical protein DES53_10956 [Roseimicrobium gellanilyticum]|uniref:Uncharacterized protein n=1 Tax=Roseimicrobium gellanilyticum TaxID=748857 RepID=A0A366HCR8_9BACT|nr:hypothetical protein [Roseimicrobium gellanilyticum]RBP39629.1 hypothetical protein DES53_10956 [Roseimicrobium gellanilyticum]
MPATDDLPWDLCFPMTAVGGFLVFWFLISPRWKAFARAYPVAHRPPGKSYKVPGVRFGDTMASYKNAARVVFAEEGLYLHMQFLCRPFHPPFLLPWECVRRVEELKGLFRRRYYHVVVEGAGEAGSMELWLPGKVEVEQELCSTFRQAVYVGGMNAGAGVPPILGTEGLAVGRRKGLKGDGAY